MIIECSKFLAALRGQGEDGQTVLLPVVRFAEPGGGESDHTARFYQGVKAYGSVIL